MSRADFTDTRRTEDFAIKLCLFLRSFCQIYTEKKEREKKKCLERRGGRNNQNATRIRWDLTPERSGRSWSEGCKEGEREKEEEEEGEIFDISLVTTRLN